MAPFTCVLGQQLVQPLAGDAAKDAQHANAPAGMGSRIGRRVGGGGGEAGCAGQADGSGPGSRPGLQHTYGREGDGWGVVVVVRGCGGGGGCGAESPDAVSQRSQLLACDRQGHPPFPRASEAEPSTPKPGRATAGPGGTCVCVCVWGGPANCSQALEGASHAAPVRPPCHSCMPLCPCLQPGLGRAYPLNPKRRPPTLQSPASDVGRLQQAQDAVGRVARVHATGRHGRHERPRA